MWYVVTAIVSVTLTYWFNTRLEPIKLAISYETRRREIMFSKLYDKQLAAYEALSIHVGELIAALARMVSVLKFIPPHRDPEEALMEMDEEHRNAVLEALKGCQQALQLNRIYLDKALFDRIQKMYWTVNGIFVEHLRVSVDSNPSNKNRMDLELSLQGHIDWLRADYDSIVEHFNSLLRESQPSQRDTFVIAFTKSWPFIEPMTIPLPHCSSQTQKPPVTCGREADSF
jgi:hypothetical protein